MFTPDIHVHYRTRSNPLAAVSDGIRLPCGTNKDLAKALLAIPLSRRFTIQYLLKSHYISLRKRMHRKIKKSFRNTKAASHSMQTVSCFTAPASYSVFFKIDPAVKDLYTVLSKPLGLRPRAAERKLP